jgi:type VI secretion system protein
MSLLVTSIKSPESVALAESSKTFGVQGGSIGRGKNNFWVLDDPSRYLSSTHCKISYENGQYFITDLSTNGTFLNGSPSPLGKGARSPVQDGDSFALGDYEFKVSILSADALSDPFSGSDTPTSVENMEDIFSAPSSGNAGFGLDDIDENLFESGQAEAPGSSVGAEPEETDPLAALDKAQSSNSDTWDSAGFGNSGDVSQSPSPAFSFTGTSHSDQADPLNQQISWPDSLPEQAPQSGGIPDDWDDDLLSPSEPVQPAQQSPITDMQAGAQFAEQIDSAENEVLVQQNQALKQANMKLQAELEILKQKLGEQQRGGSGKGKSIDTAFVDAMGFQGQNLDETEIARINQLVGEIFREMVKGLMQVLRSRNLIKSEFRMNVTTIQPKENNPLKFSASVDDALVNMFVKKSSAYINPVEAVREGFESIADHQVAILAGIREAFKTVIKRFDPVLLDARFSKQNKGGLIPGSQKAKNWELYLDYYNEMIGDIDSTFRYLFGDDFVQAYEEQLQKLAMSRKHKEPGKT